jgi:hypothetical protein
MPPSAHAGCFGRGKLIGEQFNPEANGERDHAAWKRYWEKAQSREILVLGSKKETAGSGLRGVRQLSSKAYRRHCLPFDAFCLLGA